MIDVSSNIYVPPENIEITKT
jgi:hypothetical protein